MRGQDLTATFCGTWRRVVHDGGLAHAPTAFKAPTLMDPGLSGPVYGAFRDLRLPVESQNVVSKMSRRKTRCPPGEQNIFFELNEF